jgi:hypothetical protein
MRAALFPLVAAFSAASRGYGALFYGMAEGNGAGSISGAAPRQPKTAARIRMLRPGSVISDGRGGKYTVIRSEQHRVLVRDTDGTCFVLGLFRVHNGPWQVVR